MKTNMLMPIYNAEDSLGKTLDNILNQTLKEFSLVAVNDHSTDGTLKVLKEYRSRDKRIKIIDSNGKKGIIGALNEGLANLDEDCEFIARVDCGDSYSHDRLSKQVEFLKNNQDFALVGSQFDVVCETGEPGEGMIRFKEYSNKFCSHDDIKNNYTVMAMFIHPTLTFRKSVLDKIGNYCEEYEAAEDYEIVGRIITKGYKVYKLPEALVKCNFTPNKGISQEKRITQVKTSIRIKLEYMFNNFLNKEALHSFIIWGTKDFAGFLEEQLRQTKYNSKVKCFTGFENEAWGTTKNGLPVLPPEEAIKNINKNEIVLTMWNIGREEIINFLDKNELEKNINYFVFS